MNMYGSLQMDPVNSRDLYVISRNHVVYNQVNTYIHAISLC